MLLGLRSYDTIQQALAVIIRDTELTPPPCEIQLRDQSILFASNVELQPGAIVLNDKLFGDLHVDEPEIHSFRFR